MSAILALLPSIIQLLPTITTGAVQLWQLVASIRTAAKQSGEWTSDLERQFIDALIARATDPAWQPDKPTTNL